MKRDTSADSASDLILSFRNETEKYRHALRHEDVPNANCLVLSIMRLGDSLEASQAGRDALEELLDNADPLLRLRAAHWCLKWTPERAVPVVGRLLTDDLGDDSAPFERLMIRTSASDKLFLFFGIESWRDNDLIEPLRAYGVELPHEDEEIWT